MNLREAPTAQSSERISSFRAIPSVATVIAELRNRGCQITDDALVRIVRDETAVIRDSLRAGQQLDTAEIIERIARAALELKRPRLRRILNATGVVIHTNLGRAPVSWATGDAMRQAATSAVAVEIDAESNERGGRMREIAGLLRALTGAESALVVNNCASAVLLALSALASGREVVVSRGEAVEIGGGFRIPDVLRQSGAILVEVGTTNRTYVHDYAAATTAETAAYLKVHPSNFRLHGFVSAVSTSDLVQLGMSRGVPVLEDLGSGALVDTTRFGLAKEPTIQETIAAGAALVMASGDKLLGGPQAGILAGQSDIIARVARHPLARAVRADKATLAGVAATLRHYLMNEAETSIPVWRMIGAGENEIRRRAERVARSLRRVGVDAETAAVASPVGGGSLPGETLPSWAVVLRANRDERVDDLARRLRLGEPGVFGRVDDGRLLLDLRTVLPEDDAALLNAIKQSVRGTA